MKFLFFPPGRKKGRLPKESGPNAQQVKNAVLQQVLDLLLLLDEVEIEGLAERLVDAGLRLPSEPLACVADGGDAGQHVLVPLAVVAVGGGLHHLALFGPLPVGGILLDQGEELLRQLLDRQVVPRVADVEDAAVGATVPILDDPHQAVDAVLHEGEGAALHASVHQLDRLAGQDVVEELGEDPGTPLFGGGNGVELGADPVEGAEQAVAQPLMLAVGVDDPVEHLLGAGVDPALLGDGAEHEG